MAGDIDVPILFMIFNRPSTTFPVFEKIRGARPKKIYVAADGPRSKPGEVEVCNEVRKIIEKIDWECEVHTLFRDKNLGCKDAIRTAIDWFFKNEEMGIILEDDCLADPSFFKYCEILLNHYKNDEKVVMITGTSFLNDGIDGKNKFYFSQYYAIWGWATWRRAWLNYDKDMNAWPEMKDKMVLRKKYGPCLGSHLEAICQLTYEGKINTWDAQWFISCLKNDGLCIAPKINLISNIGVEGVHYNGEQSRLLNVPISSIGDLSYFPPIQFDEKADEKAYKNLTRGIYSPVTIQIYRLLPVLWKINMKKFDKPKIPFFGKLMDKI